MHHCELFTGTMEGYCLYRIPALVVTQSDTVLAFCEARRYTGRDDDVIDILLRRSFDGGRTWDRRQTVISDGDRTCGNPCPLVDRETGVIMLPFCKDNQQVFLSRSDNDGQTWSEPIQISSTVLDPKWSYVATGPGHGIQLASGRLLVPCWCDESPGPVTWRDPPANWGKVQSSFAIYSDDHGETWRRGATATRDASDECEVVEVTGGAVYMNMRSRQETHCRAFAWSQDGGENWSPVEYDPELPEPSCQGSIVRYDTDRILLSHPSRTDSRACLTVRLSRDECRTWPIARVLEPGGAAYSDLAVTNDGNILCFFEAINDPSQLTLARFEIEWIDQQVES